MAGTRGKGSSKRAPIVSGAFGGPSTGAGLNYQINYGLLRLLQLFPEVLSFPARNPAIRLEPRELDGATVTRWDVGFESPREGNRWFWLKPGQGSYSRDCAARPMEVGLVEYRTKLGHRQGNQEHFNKSRHPPQLTSHNESSSTPVKYST
jgi:hypothetical protein